MSGFYRGNSRHRQDVLRRFAFFFFVCFFLDDTAQWWVICKELPASVAGGLLPVGQESQELRRQVGASFSPSLFPGWHQAQQQPG